MSKKFMVFIILFLVAGLMPMFLVGCSPTVAKYETTVQVEVINHEIESCCRSVIISYKIGDIEFIDELDGIGKNHYWYMVKNQADPIDLRLEVTIEKGGG